MGANPIANGGILKKSLDMPDYREYGVEVPTPGGIEKEDMRVLGKSRFRMGLNQRPPD